LPQADTCLDKHEEDVQYDREDKNTVQRLRWRGMVVMMFVTHDLLVTFVMTSLRQ
jgi:hypothetical protein